MLKVQEILIGTLLWGREKRLCTYLQAKVLCWESRVAEEKEDGRSSLP